jgi:thermostable 8-oxoguanine DNA glycosylase
MITPSVPTNFNRTQSELEEWLLFCVVVAGKTATQQAIKLEQFLNFATGTPFEKIRNCVNLRERLEESKLGQYTRIEHVFRQIVLLDVTKVTLEELESIKGIGPKSARFFFLHSFPNQNIAVLDTHILAWLREQGYQAPKSTPDLKKYHILEKIFLQEAENRKLTPAELDIQIWNERSKKIIHV